MKILITLLLALFISSQAYAQSHAEVLEKGRILQEYEERYVQRFYDPVNLEMPYLLDMKALERMRLRNRSRKIILPSSLSTTL